MTDQLVAVILVTEGGFRNLFICQLFTYMQMDMALLLIDPGYNAVQIISIRLDIFLRT